MMKEMSLATVTRVDATVAKGRICRAKGLLFFHSEAERDAWLEAVEAFDRDEHRELVREHESPVRCAERALMRRR